MTKKTRDTDVAFIQALAELLNENNLTEVEVMREYGTDDSLNVRVSRATNIIQTAQIPGPAPAPHAAMPAAVAPAAPAPVEDPASHPGAVLSPMVGTVYMSAEPGADPFVSVGSQVTEGQTLLIVEAMKTMNHIPAPAAGTVKRILAEDGGTVEFGSPLMIVE